MQHNEHPPVASFLFRKDMVEMPGLFMDAPGNDYSMMLYMASRGYIYYDRNVRSVYRYKAKGSLTEKIRGDEFENARFVLGMIIFLNRFYFYTEEDNKGYVSEKLQNYAGELFEKITPETSERALTEYLNKKVITTEEYRFYYNTFRNLEEQANNMTYLSPQTRFFCRSKEHIIIMGAGNYAKKLSDQLNNNEIEFDGYVVSDYISNPRELNGKTVWSFQNLPFKREKVYVLVGINPLRWQSIVHVLKENGINNYFCPLLFVPQNQY